MYSFQTAEGLLFPHPLPSCMVVRSLGGSRGIAENAWDWTHKALTSGTRLPIHTLSICPFTFGIPILESILAPRSEKTDFVKISLSKIL